MKVTIVGTGNVATVLGKKMKQAGIKIVEVAGRSEEHTREIAALLSASSCTDLLKINQLSDVYVLAVSDDSIEEVASLVDVGSKIIVHTAGSVSIDVLKKHAHFGVIYPLQSLSAAKTTLPTIPVLIDGESKATIDLLNEFCSIWADSVSVATDDQRLKMHVAAIFATNFTNHLYAIAEQLCNSEHLDFKMLVPLIEETASRLRKYSPLIVQTGPAARGDIATIEKHLQLLSADPATQQVYRLLSESIGRLQT
jgi:predicted short-subunit dehydrogenase-like oxidoreductase (DUF2520 family)